AYKHRISLWILRFWKAGTIPGPVHTGKWYFFGIVAGLETLMAEKQTEGRHSEGAGLDLRTDSDILALLAAGQVRAAACVESASPAIAEGAVLAAQAIRAGGRLIYAAAGSSGLMALADALELPGTY